MCCCCCRHNYLLFFIRSHPPFLYRKKYMFGPKYIISPSLLSFFDRSCFPSHPISTSHFLSGGVKHSSDRGGGKGGQRTVNKQTNDNPLRSLVAPPPTRKLSKEYKLPSGEREMLQQIIVAPLPTLPPPIQDEHIQSLGGLRYITFYGRHTPEHSRKAFASFIIKSSSVVWLIESGDLRELQ